MPSSLSLCTMNHRIQERNNRTNWMQKYIRNLRAKHVHLSIIVLRFSSPFLYTFPFDSFLLFSPLLSINNLWIRSVDESGKLSNIVNAMTLKSVSERISARMFLKEGSKEQSFKIANAQSAFLATIVFLRLPCTSAALPYSLYLAIPSSQ